MGSMSCPTFDKYHLNDGCVEGRKAIIRDSGSRVLVLSNHENSIATPEQ